MAGPKHPRHHDEAFKRQIVQSCESGKPSREIRAGHDYRAIDPAAPGPGHPRQRLRPGRGQPHARAERAGRAGEAQQAVGDGGGRFRTSGAGIRTKAGVMRAKRRPLPDIGAMRDTGRSPLHLLLDDRASRSRAVRIRSPATCARSGATAANATAPGRSRPPWRGGASPRPGDASATS